MSNIRIAQFQPVFSRDIVIPHRVAQAIQRFPPHWQLDCRVECQDDLASPHTAIERFALVWCVQHGHLHP